MDRDYSKREIDSYFEDVKENFKNAHDKLDSIEKQTKITNGNVGNLKAWRTGISMVVAVIIFLVIPLIVYSFNISLENKKNEILLEIKKEFVPRTPEEISNRTRELQAEIQLLKEQIK